MSIQGLLELLELLDLGVIEFRELGGLLVPGEKNYAHLVLEFLHLADALRI
jgi:hypothetical protein